MPEVVSRKRRNSAVVAAPAASNVVVIPASSDVIDVKNVPKIENVVNVTTSSASPAEGGGVGAPKRKKRDLGTIEYVDLTEDDDIVPSKMIKMEPIPLDISPTTAQLFGDGIVAAHTVIKMEKEAASIPRMEI